MAAGQPGGIITLVTRVCVYVCVCVCMLDIVAFSFAFSTDSVPECGQVTYGIRPILAALPAWFRFAQCLRRYYNTKKVFPHLVNAGKYSTSFFVVAFSSIASSLHDDGK